MTLINGIESAAIDVRDRGLAYGDGLFETIAVRRGCAPLLERHLARLARGLVRLGIPAAVCDAVRTDLAHVVPALESGIAKVIVTRGAGGRGYPPPRIAQPNRVVIAIPDRGEPAGATAVAVRVCATRLPVDPVLAGLKHLNRLHQVLASAELAEEFAEGLMLSVDGRVIEGTRMNLFLKRAGRWVTPRLDECGVAGIAREIVLECATALGIPIEITDVRLPDCLAVEEAFLCNSVRGIVPVLHIEGVATDLGVEPGAETRRFMRAVAEHGLGAGG